MKTISEIFNKNMSKPMCLLRGVDLYSIVAKEYFGLTCEVHEVSSLYPVERAQVKQELYYEIYKRKQPIKLKAILE